ncbi:MULTISPECIES: glycosyltransferase family 2 protein [Providencia]|uniref:glycosyltransferase family 2 protein n=1 Tax=Providencia TaxID=586 RepID=UPI0015EC12DC|nr:MULTISPECIES: glycosyltransferase family 2 protein [Providencia]QLQ65041.1 glycosyltransferase family 2 protein [Providencia rettgeri]URR21244.1 glycosyltransferase family 2 protein [Providencia rettgeri]WOB99669.1 glycosyltransferase family 2 protein [Providencia sp. PROV046]
MNKLSVIILTYNEEKHIERCIKSLKEFAHEIFIIDSFSTDNTAELAKKLGAIVYKNEWPGNHAAQFQWGLDNCPIETDWIMKMDADEYVTNELSLEIKSSLSQISNDVSGIYIKRRVFFMGKWIKHGGYYPTWLLRVWRYTDGHMEQRWMDEHIKLTRGSVIKFKHDIVDDNLNSLTWWIEKHNNYATREAADTLNIIYQFSSSCGISPKLCGTQEQRKRFLKLQYVKLPLFIRPILYFFYRYIIKLGFLDGKRGLIWHLLQGFWYRLLVDCKVFDIKRRTPKVTSKNLKIILKKIYGIDWKND